MSEIPMHWLHLRPGEMVYTRRPLPPLLADMAARGYVMRATPHAGGWLLTCISRPPIDVLAEIAYVYGRRHLR